MRKNWQKLTYLAWPPASRADLTQAFKIIKGIDNVDRSHWFELYGTTERQTRTSSYQENIVGRRSRTDVRKYQFSNRVCEEWNSLPTDVNDARNVVQLKSRLDAHRSQT